MNVFSGRSSRVLRVLLEKPKTWSLTDISKELNAQAQRVGGIVRQPMILASVRARFRKSFQPGRAALDSAAGIGGRRARATAIAGRMGGKI